MIEDFAGSSKTKTDYCKENEIPVSTFNYWVNRLEELKRAGNPGEDRFVELHERPKDHLMSRKEKQIKNMFEK